MNEPAKTWRTTLAEISNELMMAAKAAEEQRATFNAALDEANARLSAMEPFQSGWEDPDLTIVNLQAALDDARAALKRIRTLAESWHVIAASPTAFNRQFQVGVALALAGVLKILDGNEAGWESYLPALASIDSRLKGATT